MDLSNICKNGGLSMIYTAHTNELSQINKQIELSLFVKEFSDMVEKIEKEEIDEVKIKIGISFLTEAKHYAEGKESCSFEFLPSEAFNYTLKALDLGAIKNRNLSDAIDDLINELCIISSGVYSNQKLVIQFFQQLTKVITYEKDKPTKLIGTLI